MNERITKENSILGEKYDIIYHESGLRIYVFPKNMSTYYALIGVRYGSIDNCFKTNNDKTFIRVPDGVAHFLEHKLFETEDGDETTDMRFAALGASSNAFTSSDMTAYEFSCTDHFYDSLEILLDFVTHPYFTEENVKKEQGIIGQEIDMFEDMPTRKLYHELLNALYVYNNTRILVCGTQESIAQITPAHLYNCYHTFYQPNNMTLAICGNVETSKVEAVVDSILDSTTKVDIERYVKAEPFFSASKRRSVVMQVARPLFAIGIKDITNSAGTAAGVRRSFLFRMIADWLFGTASAFYEAAYDEGVLNAKFSAGYDGYRTCGFFWLSGETDDPEAIYSRIWNAIEGYKRNPPPREDFFRIKKALYAEYIRDFDSTEEIANNLLSYSLMDVDLLEIGDMINGITYEEAVNAIQDFFVEEQSAMATVLPKEN